MDKSNNIYNILDKSVKIIFVFLIGLIFYTIYKSEIIFQGLYREYYLKYYILLILSSLILFFIFFLKKKVKLKIYLVLLSALFALYILEILLIDFKSLSGKTKYQHYKDLKKENDIVVAIHPTQFILKDINKKKIFPLSGISEKLTILCKRKENKKFVVYKSDRYGFRNNNKNWDEEEVDFVLLGDSLVHGSCVDSNKTIDSQIFQISKNKFNKKVNSINLGFGGNGPLLEYATLKEYLKYINAKKVLYFFYEGNDFDNLYFEIKDPLLKNYLNSNFEQKLIGKQTDVNKVNKILLNDATKKKRTKLYSFVKLGKLRSKLSNILNKKSKLEVFKFSNESYEIYKNILINIKELTESRNAELYFIYLPYISRFSDRNYDTNHEIHSKIMSITKGLNIKSIDILNEIKLQNIDPLPLFELKKHQHLNEKGYQFVADTIIKKLIK